MVSLEVAQQIESLSRVIVTTCDLKEPYEIIAPIYFQISNVGLFGNKLRSLQKKYSEALSNRQNPEQIGIGNVIDELFFASVGQSDFENAFYISILEIKRIARSMNANAIIGLRQDTDLDTTGIQNFYMQMYGTAVKRINRMPPILDE